MALSVLHDWLTQIESEETNSKLQFLSNGILSGGIVTGDPANPQVVIRSFIGYTREGLLIESDASEIVAIPAENATYYVCLHARYDAVNGTVPYFLTTLDPVAHPEAAYLIVIAEVFIPTGQGHVNIGDISYSGRQETDVHGRSVLRGAVDTAASLPTAVIDADGKKLVEDDVYFVQDVHEFYYWTGSAWSPVNSNSLKTIEVHNGGGGLMPAGTVCSILAESGTYPSVVVANALPTTVADRGRLVMVPSNIGAGLIGLAVTEGLVDADMTGISVGSTVYAGAGGTVSGTKDIEYAQRLGVCTVTGAAGSFYFSPAMRDEDNEESVYQWVYNADAGAVGPGIVMLNTGTGGTEAGVVTPTDGSDNGVPVYLSTALTNPGDYGYALVQGIITGIDATGGGEAWTAGQTLYAKYDTGQFSKYAHPMYTAHRVGIVLNAANPGSIYFFPPAKIDVGASNAVRIQILNTSLGAYSPGHVVNVSTSDPTGFAVSPTAVQSDEDGIPVMVAETIASGDVGWAVVFGQVNGVDTTVAPALGPAGSAFYTGIGAAGRISPYASYGYHRRLGIVLTPGVAGSVFFYPEPQTYRMAGEAVRQLVYNDSALTGGPVAKDTVVVLQSQESATALCPKILISDPTASLFSGGVGSLALVLDNPIAADSYGYVTVFGVHPDVDTSSWLEGSPLHSTSAGALTDTAVSEVSSQVGHVVYSDASVGTIFVNPVPLTHKLEYSRTEFMAADAALEGTGVVVNTNTGVPGAPRRNVVFPTGVDGYARWIVPIPSKLRKDIERASSYGLPNADQVDFMIYFYVEVPVVPVAGSDTLHLTTGYNLYSVPLYTNINAPAWSSALAGSTTGDNVLPVYANTPNTLVYFTYQGTGVVFRDTNLIEIHFEREGTHVNDTYPNAINLIAGDVTFSYPYSTI